VIENTMLEHGTNPYSDIGISSLAALTRMVHSGLGLCTSYLVHPFWKWWVLYGWSRKTLYVKSRKLERKKTEEENNWRYYI